MATAPTNDRLRHLNINCDPETGPMMDKLDKLIRANFPEAAPDWTPQRYVAYKIGGKRWLYVRTREGVLGVRFFVEPHTFNQAALAKRLGLIEHDKQSGQDVKLSQPSAVLVEPKSGNRDEVALKLRPDYDIESPVFLAFLKDAHRAFPR